MKKRRILAGAMVLCLGGQLVGCGSANGEDVTRAFLTACYEEDAKAMISLLPDEYIDHLMDEYGCTKQQLIDAVKAEIPNEAREYSYCDEVNEAHFLEDISKKDFDDYFDRRVEFDKDDFNEISAIKTYKVDVADDRYYSNLSAFEYDGDWYSVDAANFVAYAVWEEY